MQCAVCARRAVVGIGEAFVVNGYVHEKDRTAEWHCCSRCKWQGGADDGVCPECGSETVLDHTLQPVSKVEGRKYRVG